MPSQGHTDSQQVSAEGNRGRGQGQVTPFSALRALPPPLPSALPPPIHLLGGELADQLEGGKTGIGKAVFVAAHLEGTQPVADRAEGGVMGQPLVQQRVGRPGGRGGSGRISSQLGSPGDGRGGSHIGEPPTRR